MGEQLVPEDEDLFGCSQTTDVTPTEKPVPFVGLKNLGNSCYFNSVLQVLLHCPVLMKCINIYADEAKSFLTEDWHNVSTKKVKYGDCNKKKCQVLSEFLALQEDIFKKQLALIANGCGNGESGSEYALEPRSLLENLQSVYPSFEPFAQQDAQECLQCFLDILHESISMFSNTTELGCTPFSKNEPVKVLGGSKCGKAVVANDDHDVNDTLKNMKMMKPAATRKRGMRSLFKNPLKRSRDSDKENTSPQQNGYSAGAPFSNKTANKRPCKPNDYFSGTATIPNVKLAQKRKAALALHEAQKDLIVPGLKDVPLDRKKKELIELLRIKSGCDAGMNEDLAHISNGLDGINEVSSDLTENFMLSKSFVESLFQGEIVNESRCLECENSGHRVETFMDVSLPVCQSDKEEDQEAHKSPNPSTEEFCVGAKCSVSWGMAAFASREMLNGENKYYCDACKRYCEGERRLLLNRLPPLLTFHLKRFTSSLDEENSFGVSVSKINTCFEVPVKLSLKQWCSSSCNDSFDYNLFAIIVHSGTTVCSGHYLAYIKILPNTMRELNDVVLAKAMQPYYGRWLETDDERVRVISDEKFQEVITPIGNGEAARTPYLLFYCNNTMK